MARATVVEPHFRVPQPRGQALPARPVRRWAHVKICDMRIAVAQLNQVIGDLGANAAAILDATRAAERDGAHLIVTPELSLCGYQPEDLLLRDAFVDACRRELTALAGADR